MMFRGKNFPQKNSSPKQLNVKTIKNTHVYPYPPTSVIKLKAVRKTEAGVFLDANTNNTKDDILLHHLQQTREISLGEMVEVFLYLDPKKRLTASMHLPKMQIGQIARLKVINVTKDGAFVDVGAERGIFMPFASMRGRVKIGEVIWGKLYVDKSRRLAVTMEVEDEIRRLAKNGKNVPLGTILQGEVYNYTDKGAFVFSKDHYIIFIDNKELKFRPKVGETVDVRVTYAREDGRLNGSLREIKEKALLSDSKMLIKFLQARKGKMPYSDATSPLIIKKQFNLSKSAFKRALGHLLKEGLIEQKNDWTYLKK